MSVKKLSQAIKRSATAAVEEAGFDRMRAGRVIKINSDNTCVITVDGRTYNKVPVYGDTTGLTINKTYKVFIPNNQSSQMFVMVPQSVPEGISVTGTRFEYYLSTSDTEPTGGSWQTDPPTWVTGRFMWVRLVLIYSDGTTYTGAPWNTTQQQELATQWDEPDATTFSTTREVHIDNSLLVNYTSKVLNDNYKLQIFDDTGSYVLGIAPSVGGVYFSAGSGGGRPFNFSGNILPTVDATYDLGSTSFKWRNLYLSNDVFLAGNSLTTTLSNKADLVDGKVPLTQLPDIDSYWVLNDSENTISTTYATYINSANLTVSNGYYLRMLSSDNSILATIQQGSTSMFYRTAGTQHVFDKQVVPITDDTLSLGTSTLRWTNGYFSDTLYANELNINGNVINWDDLGKQWDDFTTGTLKTDKVISVGSNDNVTYPLTLKSANNTRLAFFLSTDSARFLASDNVSGFIFNKRVYPTPDATLDLGLSSARWRNINASGSLNVPVINLNGINLATTLSAKADLINGKVPNSQLPENIGYWKLNTDGTKITTDQNIIIQPDKRLYFSSTSAYMYGNGGSVVFGGESVQLAPDVATPFTQLGRVDAPWGFGYITNIETYSNVSNSYFNVGHAIDQLKSEKADLVNGKVPTSQLPDGQWTETDTTLSTTKNVTIGISSSNSNLTVFGDIMPGSGTRYIGSNTNRFQTGYFADRVLARDFVLDGYSLTNTILPKKADLGSDGKVLPSQLPDSTGGGDSFWNNSSLSGYVSTTAANVNVTNENAKLRLTETKDDETFEITRTISNVQLTSSYGPMIMGMDIRPDANKSRDFGTESVQFSKAYFSMGYFDNLYYGTSTNRKNVANIRNETPFVCCRYDVMGSVSTGVIPFYKDSSFTDVDIWAFDVDNGVVTCNFTGTITIQCQLNLEGLPDVGDFLWQVLKNGEFYRQSRCNFPNNSGNATNFAPVILATVPVTNGDTVSISIASLGGSWSYWLINELMVTRVG